VRIIGNTQIRCVGKIQRGIRVCNYHHD